MKIRFESDYISAKKILNDYLTENDYLNSDRIIRCVIYLSDNGIESYKSFLETAKGDPRDVILWAEYQNSETLNNKRVRNFNKSFKENKIKNRRN